MNKYYADVYEIAARIPVGKVTTYGMIAAMLGNGCIDFKKSMWRPEIIFQ